MDVWLITVAVVRRWYVTFPMLALTVLAAFVVGRGVNPLHQVSSTAVLVPGPEASQFDNPYGSMDQVSQVLTVVLEDARTRTALEDRGLEPGYEVAQRSRSRILDITVSNEDPNVSLATAEAVLDRLREELLARQKGAGIPAEAQVGLEVLSPPAVIDVVTQGKTRNMVIVMVIGTALTVLTAVLLDDVVGLLRRQQARRREEARKTGRRRPPRATTRRAIGEPSEELTEGGPSANGGNDADPGRDGSDVAGPIVTGSQG